MSRSLWAALRVLAAATMLACRWAPRAWAPDSVLRVRSTLDCDMMSQADAERQDHGYYDQLLKTAREPGVSPAICEFVPELREVVLKPSMSIIRPNGAKWTTNALGMRDQPYAAAKPAGTFRVALTGDSIGVGLGVNDGEGFEPRLERMLAARARACGGPAVEILNLAVPGRSPGQRWDHFRRAGWALEPDLVLFEATPADIGWDQRRLSELLPQGIGWDTTLYGDVLKRAQIRPGAKCEDYACALEPYRWDLVAAAYRTVAAESRARGVPCLWVLIPRVGRAVAPADLRRLVSLAQAAGFTDVVDLSSAFDAYDPAALALGPGDFHPNVDGHALLASRLAAVLWPQPALSPLWRPAGCSGSPAPRSEAHR
jgi:lysophospholipase L1-like esterase